LFKVNTGCREQEVCGLRWEWEVQVPELKSSVFIIPGARVKNREDRLVVMNRVARSVIEEARGKHPDFVFTYHGHLVRRINNNGWRCARRSVGLSQVRVHDSKHTCGRRLRAAGVPVETRRVLLGTQERRHHDALFRAGIAGVDRRGGAGLSRRLRQNFGNGLC
jgi:integrase